jgi:hypothetical protein
MERNLPSQFIRNCMAAAAGENNWVNLVREGGFEPPRLAAPPPQDGVSASSTTPAMNNRKFSLHCLRLHAIDPAREAQQARAPSEPEFLRA